MQSEREREQSECWQVLTALNKDAHAAEIHRKHSLNEKSETS